VETVSEEAFFNSSKATVSASGIETGSGGAKTDCVIVLETVSEEIVFNPSKAMNSASSVETGSGGSKVDCVMAEGPSSKTLPVGGLAGLVVETVLDEEASAAAILLVLVSRRRIGSAGLASPSWERSRRETVQGHKVRFGRSSGVHVVRVLV
jgi:hypothetical protein